MSDYKSFSAMRKFIKNLFSIKNNGINKEIKVLGVTIKINRNFGVEDFYKFPIQTNKIVFSNFNGKGFGCNPKYIAEKLIQSGEKYDLVWLCEKSFMQKKNFPKEIRLVNYKSLGAMKEIVTSKVFIHNVHSNSLIHRGWEKRDGQIYINTWHGSLGIKKIDAGVTTKSFVETTWYKTAKKDSSMIDYVLSNSSFDNMVFKNDFWYDNGILEFGHPRNDIFFWKDEDKSKIKDKVYKKLDINPNSKIFLYVPSFRDNGKLDCYEIDILGIKSALMQKTNEEWVILVRLHPHLRKYSKKLFNFSDSVIDATSYPDIQELLVSSDIAATDYSSCIFDFMFSKKPAFIYAPDIEEYNTDRGFYYPLETTPFPIATNNKEMIDNIMNFSEDEYKIKVEEFLKSKGCFEDGKASERVAEFIHSQVNLKE